MRDSMALLTAAGRRTLPRPDFANRAAGKWNRGHITPATILAASVGRALIDGKRCVNVLRCAEWSKGSFSCFVSIRTAAVRPPTGGAGVKVRLTWSAAASGRGRCGRCSRTASTVVAG